MTTTFRDALGATLAGHMAREGRERALRDEMMRLVEDERCCERSSVAPGHFTVSAFVADADLKRLLLIRHPTLGLSLQPGGHIDALDETPLDAALRELREEVGPLRVIPLPGSPHLLDLDVHDIPANTRRGEAPHKHFDLRFGLHAYGSEALGGELSARWVPFDALASAGTDASVLRTAARLRELRSVLDASSVYSSAAALRNRDAVLEVIRPLVDPGDLVLELASGSGEHAEYFASALADVVFQPSDAHEQAWASCWWRWRGAGLENLRPPLMLDVGAGTGWPDHSWGLLVATNIMQVTPWSTTLRLLADGAARAREGAKLAIYSPMSVGGVHISDGNRAFDAQLRRRDPRLGVRDRDALIVAAEREGWGLLGVHNMPANNTMVIFERRSGLRG